MIDRLCRWWLQRGTPKDHPFTHVEASGLDYRGIPTAECVCGTRTFYVVAWLDDAYCVTGYDTTGLCADCGALITIATEIDHHDYEGA